jgi:hypothetical protein
METISIPCNFLNNDLSADALNPHSFRTALSWRIVMHDDLVLMFIFRTETSLTQLLHVLSATPYLPHTTLTRENVGAVELYS